MAEQHLTKSELAIMEVMWEQEDYQSIWGQGMEEQFYSSHGECFT